MDTHTDVWTIGLMVKLYPGQICWLGPQLSVVLLVNKNDIKGVSGFGRPLNDTSLENPA